MFLSILTAVLACYFLGNHNGAVCVSAMLGDDVRQHGSGNAGLTNFIRNYGASRSAMVILIDAGKAVLACLLAGCMLAPYGYALEGKVLGGLCVIVGHVFPALLGFRGGKGILSGLFVALVIDWRVAVIICVVFFAVYFMTRYVSLGSILGATAFGVSFVIIYYDNLWVCFGGIFMSVLTVFMHRGNIARLAKGQESKTDLFKRGVKK